MYSILLQTTPKIVPLWSRFGREGEFVVTIYLNPRDGTFNYLEEAGDQQILLLHESQQNG